MVASTHNLEELGVSHPANASNDRQQQEKHGPAYRSAQTAQDKRSRLSNVINNLRKKVPESSGDQRREEDDRNSVERNLETLEKYVMTVLNGVIKDEEDEEKESRGAEASRVSPGAEDPPGKEADSDAGVTVAAETREPFEPDESRVEAAAVPGGADENVAPGVDVVAESDESRNLDGKDVLEGMEKIHRDEDPVDEPEDSRRSLDDRGEDRLPDPAENLEEEVGGTEDTPSSATQRGDERKSEEERPHGRENRVPRDQDLETRVGDSGNRPVKNSSGNPQWVEPSRTTLHCSLPLEKVGLALHGCQSTSESTLDGTSLPLKTLAKPPSPPLVRHHLCLYCDRKFLSMSLWQRHTERVHQLGGGRRSERNSRKPSQSCQYCTEKCPDTLEGLFRHMVSSHGDKYHGCVQCSTRYATRDALASHGVVAHGTTLDRTPRTREKTKEATFLTREKSEDISDAVFVPKESLRDGQLDNDVENDDDDEDDGGNGDGGGGGDDGDDDGDGDGDADGNENEDEDDEDANDDDEEDEKGKGMGNGDSDEENDENAEASEKEDGGDNGTGACLESRGEATRSKIVPTTAAKDAFGNPGSPEFDSSFYSSVSCNIRENLLHHIDGKLQAPSTSGPSEPKQSYREPGVTQVQCPIDISLTAATPVYTGKEYPSEDGGNASESARKPGKHTRTHPRRVSFEKYNFPRKYDGREEWTCSIKDLSKFDISTQLTLRMKQRLIEERVVSSSPPQTQTSGATESSPRLEDPKDSTDFEDSMDLQNQKEASGTWREVTEFGAEFASFMRLKKWSDDRIGETGKSQETIYAELTGEWSRPRVYICGACAARYVTLKEMEEHKAASHPNVWCSHFEFSGDQRELYKHLVFLPSRSLVAAKLRGGVAPEKVCTKCSKNCNTLAELHRHMLECGGDQAWLLGLFGNGKKKCKWRPFGSRSRRRRQRGMKRNIQNSQTPRVNVPKERPTSGPRVRPSDLTLFPGESIQKMLANLPPKRATRKVLQDNSTRTNSLRNVQTRSRPRMPKDGPTTVLSRNKAAAAVRNKLLKNAKSYQRNRCRIDNITAVIESVVQNHGTDERDEVEGADDDAEETDKEELEKASRSGKAEGGAKSEKRPGRARVFNGVRVISKKRNVKNRSERNVERSRPGERTKEKFFKSRRALGRSRKNLDDENVDSSFSEKIPRNASKTIPKTTLNKVPVNDEKPLDDKSYVNDVKPTTCSTTSERTCLRRKRIVDPAAHLNASLKAKAQLRTHDGKFARNPGAGPSGDTLDMVPPSQVTRTRGRGRFITRSKMGTLRGGKNELRNTRRMTRFSSLSSDSDKMPTLEPVVDLATGEECGEKVTNDLPVLSPATAPGEQRVARSCSRSSSVVSVIKKKKPGGKRSATENDTPPSEEVSEKSTIEEVEGTSRAQSEQVTRAGRGKRKQIMVRQRVTRVMVRKERAGNTEVGTCSKEIPSATPKRLTRFKARNGTSARRGRATRGNAQIRRRSASSSKLSKTKDDDDDTEHENDFMANIVPENTGVPKEKGSIRPKRDRQGQGVENSDKPPNDTADVPAGKKLPKHLGEIEASKKFGLKARDNGRKALRHSGSSYEAKEKERKGQGLMSGTKVNQKADKLGQRKSARNVRRGSRSNEREKERGKIENENVKKPIERGDAHPSSKKGEIVESDDVDLNTEDADVGEIPAERVSKEDCPVPESRKDNANLSEETDTSIAKESTNHGRRRGKTKSVQVETADHGNFADDLSSLEKISKPMEISSLAKDASVNARDDQTRISPCEVTSDTFENSPRICGVQKDLARSKDPVNLALEHLQQESSNSNIDSGKENSSETPVNVPKLKVVRPKKSRGLRRERGSKRSLSNVIGILTEGVNIPVEVQQSVVLTVQTSLENAVGPDVVQSSTQQIVEDDAIAGAGSNLDKIKENNDLGSDKSAKRNDVEPDRVKGNEVPERNLETSDPVPAQTSEDSEFSSDFGSNASTSGTEPTVKSSTKYEEEAWTSPEDANGDRRPEIPHRRTRLSASSRELQEGSAAPENQPANDIILDLSRRKPKGKGSFLEKIVSKIAKKKDALKDVLEGEVGSLLDNAADELTNILDEVEPILTENPESISIAEPKNTIERVAKETSPRSQESVKSDVQKSRKEAKVDDSCNVIDTETVHNCKTNSKHFLQESRSLHNAHVQISLDPDDIGYQIPGEPGKISKVTEETSNEQGRISLKTKRESKKRSLEIHSPRRSKRKSLDAENETEDDSPESEISLADIMKLINKPQQTNTSGQSEQSDSTGHRSGTKVRLGKRKNVDEDDQSKTSNIKAKGIPNEKDDSVPEVEAADVRKSKRKSNEMLSGLDGLSSKKNNAEISGTDDNLISDTHDKSKESVERHRSKKLLQPEGIASVEDVPKKPEEKENTTEEADNSGHLKVINEMNHEKPIAQPETLTAERNNRIKSNAAETGRISPECNKGPIKNDKEVGVGQVVSLETSLQAVKKSIDLEKESDATEGNDISCKESQPSLCDDNERQTPKKKNVKNEKNAKRSKQYSPAIKSIEIVDETCASGNKEKPVKEDGSCGESRIVVEKREENFGGNSVSRALEDLQESSEKRSVKRTSLTSEHLDLLDGTHLQPLPEDRSNESHPVDAIGITPSKKSNRKASVVDHFKETKPKEVKKGEIISVRVKRPELFKIPETNNAPQSTKKRTSKKWSLADEHLELPDSPPQVMSKAPDVEASTSGIKNLEVAVPSIGDTSEGINENNDVVKPQELELESVDETENTSDAVIDSSTPVSNVPSIKRRSTKRKKFLDSQLGALDSTSFQEKTSDKSDVTDPPNSNQCSRPVSRRTSKRKTTEDDLEDASDETKNSLLSADSEPASAGKTGGFERRQVPKRKAKANISLLDEHLDLNDVLDFSDVETASLHDSEEISARNISVNVELPIESLTVETTDELPTVVKDVENKNVTPETADTSVDVDATSDSLKEDVQTPKKRASGNFAVVHTKSGEILIVEKKKKITKEVAKFFCDVCTTSFTRKSSLKKHNSSQSHLLQLAKVGKDSDKEMLEQIDRLSYSEGTCEDSQGDDSKTDAEQSTECNVVHLTPEESANFEELQTEGADENRARVKGKAICDSFALDASKSTLTSAISENELEDELLDEEICKITENMTHDEYVLTDQVSPTAPEATSTPLMPATQTKVQDNPKKSKKLEKKQPKRRNLAEEHLDLDTPEPDASLEVVEETESADRKLGKGTISSAENAPILGTHMFTNVVENEPMPLLESHQSCSGIILEENDRIGTRKEKQGTMSPLEDLVGIFNGRQEEANQDILKHNSVRCEAVSISKASQGEASEKRGKVSEDRSSCATTNIGGFKMESNLSLLEETHPGGVTLPVSEEKNYQKNADTPRKIRNQEKSEEAEGRVEVLSNEKEPLKVVTDANEERESDEVNLNVTKKAIPIERGGDKTNCDGLSRKNNSSFSHSSDKVEVQDVLKNNAFNSANDPASLAVPTKNQQDTAFIVKPSEIDLIISKSIIETSVGIEGNAASLFEEEQIKLGPNSLVLNEDDDSSSFGDKPLSELLPKIGSGLKSSPKTHKVLDFSNITERLKAQMPATNETNVSLLTEFDSDENSRDTEMSVDIQKLLEDAELCADDKKDAREDELKVALNKEPPVYIESRNTVIPKKEALPGNPAEEKLSKYLPVKRPAGNTETESPKDEVTDDESSKKAHNVEGSQSSNECKSITKRRTPKNRPKLRESKKSRRSHMKNQRSIPNNRVDNSSESDTSYQEDRVESRNKSKIVKSVFGRVLSGDKTDKVKEVLDDWDSRSEEETKGSDPRHVRGDSSPSSMDCFQGKKNTDAVPEPNSKLNDNFGHPERTSTRNRKRIRSRGTIEGTAERDKGAKSRPPSGSREQEDIETRSTSEERGSNAKPRTCSGPKKQDHVAYSVPSLDLVLPNSRYRQSKKKAEERISKAFEEESLILDDVDKSLKASRPPETSYELRNPSIIARSNSTTRLSSSEVDISEPATYDLDTSPRKDRSESKKTIQTKVLSEPKRRGRKPESETGTKQIKSRNLDDASTASEGSLKFTGPQEDLTGLEEMPRAYDDFPKPLSPARNIVEIGASRNHSLDRLSRSSMNSDEENEEENDDEDLARGRMSPLFYDTPDSSLDDMSDGAEDEPPRKRSSSEFSGEKVVIRSPLSSQEDRHEVVIIAPTDAIEDNALDVPREIETSPQKSRQGKVLNFDEELFVECCSRLKATTENELRGAKKIKLDHCDAYHKKEEPPGSRTTNRDRWRDVESQNSLGSLLESVNQLLGEEMYGTKERDYSKRTRDVRSENSSRSASPDPDLSRRDNVGYEDSLDVAFEHNNKLRDKIQQRMRESESLIASTFGQGNRSSSFDHRHHHRHHRNQERKSGHEGNDLIFGHPQGQGSVSTPHLSNGELGSDRANERTEQSGQIRVDSSGFKSKVNSTLGGLLDKALSNLLHNNGKHDHNGSTPMKVLAELACARAPSSTNTEVPHSISAIRCATAEIDPVLNAGPDSNSVKEQPPKKSRNPIKELFEKKKEMNERRQVEKCKSGAALKELTNQHQRKTKKTHKRQDFPLVRRNQHGGLAEKKKRRECFEKRVEPQADRVKDVYDFDDDESQAEVQLGPVLSYRSKMDKSCDLDSLKEGQIDMSDGMSKTIGDTLENGRSSDVLGRRLETIIDRKFKEMEKYAPKTKGALKSFQSEEKQQQEVTGPMDNFVERKQKVKRSVEPRTSKHSKLKKRNRNSKKKSRNAWYEDDSSDEFRTAAKTEDIGVGISKSQRSCSKGKQNLFAELSTSSESEFEDEDVEYTSRRELEIKCVSRNAPEGREREGNEIREEMPEEMGNKCDVESIGDLEVTHDDREYLGKRKDSDAKKSESEISDRPLIIDERKESEEQRNSDEETETQYDRSFELDDLYREDSSAAESDPEDNILEDKKNTEETRAESPNSRELFGTVAESKEKYLQEEELIPLEKALDILDHSEGLSREEPNDEEKNNSLVLVVGRPDSVMEAINETSNSFEKIEKDVADLNEDRDDDLLDLPEKLTSNEKPKNDSENLPLHVFLSRKVQESKKRKQQQQELKKLQEEQERILLDFQPTRRQRKCAIGKQGLLAEFSSSDDELYVRVPYRKSGDRSDTEHKVRRPKRESKEKRKERYIEKKHEQMIAKEQKAIEEEILREVEKKKEIEARDDQDSDKDYVDKPQTETKGAHAGKKTDKSAQKRKPKQKEKKFYGESEDVPEEGDKNSNEGNDVVDKPLGKSTRDDVEEESSGKQSRTPKVTPKPKKNTRTDGKGTNGSKSGKSMNGERSKNRSSTSTSKDPKERRSSSAKRDSADEELRTTKSWNKVEEGVGVAIGRRKRTAANQLYYWSSSSDEDETVDSTPIVEEEEDDHQEQHGWIVGDSHKKMITMLAMEKQLKEKRRRSEDEFDPGKAKSKKHRNSTS
ncbi:microtubule-associated protein futsch isoform X2 [Orussus abietinus]|uniref:microtubule-associated protein futsch isoform X2 n=1 Tax=Orussus abietinus TaxID=222816 RepID=UPI0006255008|nr:microtubule-associated protein futsch isoform X2 [Orussus abietinus]